MDTYAITLDEYDELLVRQHGSCAICRRKPRYNLDVDHDHAVEKQLLANYPQPQARRMSVRGLLCKLCNRRLLPAARDDAETLTRAIAYLSSPPATKVITDAV